VRRLTELKPGQSGRIATVGGDPGTARRLMDMGVVRGARMEVVRAAPLGDPLEVRLRGYMLTLRRAEAEHIEVE
jgi:ferrous iron transport protein A